jgi:Ca-activated chloride channel family protein
MRRIIIALTAAIVLLAPACSSKYEEATSTIAPPQQRARKPMPLASSAGMEAGGTFAYAPPAAAGYAREDAAFNTEEYGRFEENPFFRPTDQPLSTFSIDVDRASYANVRRFLNSGQRPPRDAVRIEEMVNYFTYDYPEPAGAPFSISTEVANCPWNAKHKLLMIGLQGRRLDTKDLPPNNFVFLIDTSGSMMSADKLPLVQEGLELLVGQLREEDRVAIVTYAGSAGLVLPPTSGARKGEILAAIDQLEAGGSTAGAQGIITAYDVARQNFDRKSNNRVILATDGDFNVGVSSDGELQRLIEARRDDGIFLTVLGFGTGNIKDSKMELLANKGNGNYSYIDSLAEARKTLVREMGATLFTIAKDVKIQVEFNPAAVGAYRLIGYENRVLQNQDFNDDKKDAGELGAGHSVTALYEIVPPGEPIPGGSVDPLKYQAATVQQNAGELATVKLRYKEPDGDTSRLLTRTVQATESGGMSENLRLAAAVAQLGMLLRNSESKGSASFESVEQLASAVASKDQDRRDFMTIVARAKELSASDAYTRK